MYPVRQRHRRLAANIRISLELCRVQTFNNRDDWPLPNQRARQHQSNDTHRSAVLHRSIINTDRLTEAAAEAAEPATASAA